MANPNVLLTDDIILKTALMEFDNNLVFAKTARRDYEDKFTPSTGSTIRIRKPTRYLARYGETAQIQSINEQYTSISVSPMVGVDVQVSSTQFALQLDDFNREVINPAMVTLANAIDIGLYNTTTDLYNFVGTAGSAPASFAVVSQAAATLSRFGIPRSDRFLLAKTDDAASLHSALYNTFNEKFNTKIIMDGSMGNLAGFDVYDVQNAIRPSRGSASLGTPAINGAGQSGTTLILDGFTAGVTLKKGALFTIANVNSLNPASREDTGQLWQGSVFADVTADGSGNMTITLGDEDPITLTGPYQTVSAAPADGALLTFQATHTKNIFYHREAFALAMIKLPENRGAVYQKNMMNPKSKTSIRMTRSYDANTDKEMIRFDILPAYKCFPQYGGVLMGS